MNKCNKFIHSSTKNNYIFINLVIVYVKPISILIVKPNNSKKLSKLIVCLLLIILSNSGLFAQEKDSLITPFRKGRWLTGLSGTISSSTTNIGQNSDYSNKYGIAISTGNFVIPRLLVGALFNAQRDQSTSYTDRETESLFVGPDVTYYLSKDRVGSVFISIVPGYVRYRENASIIQNTLNVNEKLEGDGIGLKLAFGYSYVLHDRIAFDLGLVFSRFQINATRTSEPIGNTSDEIVNIGDLSFFFGFNVLLDSFSF